MRSEVIGDGGTGLGYQKVTQDVLPPELFETAKGKKRVSGD